MKKKITLLALAGASLLGLSANAQIIVSLVNPGFESPNTVKINTGFDDAGGLGDVPGWQDGGATQAGSGVETGGAHGGTWKAFQKSQNDSAFQVTSYTITEGEVFDLNWFIWYGGSTPVMNVSLFKTTDGGTTRTPLATLTHTTSVLNIEGSGVWQEKDLSYTAVAADTGTTIGIEFWNSGSSNRWISYDDFSLLVTPVPEPSTYALIGGFMALGLVMLRRRLRG